MYNTVNLAVQVIDTYDILSQTMMVDNNLWI